MQYGGWRGRRPPGNFGVGFESRGFHGILLSLHHSNDPLLGPRVECHALLGWCVPEWKCGGGRGEEEEKEEEEEEEEKEEEEEEEKEEKEEEEAVSHCVCTYSLKRDYHGKDNIQRILKNLDFGHVQKIK